MCPKILTYLLPKFGPQTQKAHPKAAAAFGGCLRRHWWLLSLPPSATGLRCHACEARRLRRLALGSAFSAVCCQRAASGRLPPPVRVSIPLVNSLIQFGSSVRTRLLRSSPPSAARPRRAFPWGASRIRADEEGSPQQDHISFE